MRHIAEQLLAAGEGPCITILLPLLNEPGHADENAKRLHRLLDDVEGQLENHGIDGKAKGQYLAPARNFADEQLSVPPSGKTLAMFVSSSVFRIYLLPQETEESVSISPHFRILPVLADEEEAARYFILAVSKKKASLYEVNGRSVEERAVDGMPASLEDAWKGMEHTEKNLQFHSTGNGTVAFHGHGGAKDQQDVEAEVYFKSVAKSIHTLIHETKIPLVFAGVEEAYGLFKKFDETGMLLEEYVRGNPDTTEKEDLREQSLPIVAKESTKHREQLAERFGTAAANGKGTDDVGDVLKAAAEGRVDTLLLNRDATEWGTVGENGESVVHVQKEAGDEDLSSVAASWTLRNSGNVVLFPQEEMPSKSPMAAILRFS